MDGNALKLPVLRRHNHYKSTCREYTSSGTRNMLTLLIGTKNKQGNRESKVKINLRCETIIGKPT